MYSEKRGELVNVFMMSSSVYSERAINSRWA